MTTPKINECKGVIRDALVFCENIDTFFHALSMVLSETKEHIRSVTGEECDDNLEIACWAVNKAFDDMTIGLEANDIQPQSYVQPKQASVTQEQFDKLLKKLEDMEKNKFTVKDPESVKEEIDQSTYTQFPHFGRELQKALDCIKQL